jgi:Fur family peroxide stress response transcriptional regulator
MFIDVILIIVIIIDYIYRIGRGAYPQGMSGTERKHSKKRDAILEILRSTQSHPGAQWIYQKLKPAIPSLSLGTVYRNINLFKEEGSAISVCVINGEERFDGQVEPHPHLICCCCGKVEDLLQPADEACPEAAKTGGFIIDRRKTMYYGLCEECAAAARTEDAAKPDDHEEIRTNM